jgi:nitroreductase
MPIAIGNASSEINASRGGTGMGTRTEEKLTDIVRKRRATPAFSSAPVREEDLRKILRAGLEAPSSYNMQPWRFVVVRDLEQRRRLRVAAMNQEQVEQAPVIIVACGDTEGWREDLEEVIRIGRDHGFNEESHIERKRKNVTNDLGSQPNMAMWVTKQTMIAATTMMWVAEALGYDTGPMEGFYEDQVREVLGIPEHVRVIFLLAIGHLQGEDGSYPGRLPASRTVFAERYGEPPKFDLVSS